MKAVFLDRDGVINKLIVDHGYQRSPRSADEFIYSNGIHEFVAEIRQIGFVPVVITNQPEVKRKLVAKEIVDQINDKVSKELDIAHIYVCWHDDNDHCDCRKPRPGLLLRAARDLDIDLQSSYLVGDREKDYFAAISAGCKGILYGKQRVSEFPTFSNFNDILVIIQHG